jgi:hypothetical protein
MKRKIVAAAIVLAACTAASAGPAPWYQWRSRVDHNRVCAQNMPVQGWEKASGPYKDSRCEKPIVAK